MPAQCSAKKAPTSIPSKIQHPSPSFSTIASAKPTSTSAPPSIVPSTSGEPASNPTTLSCAKPSITSSLTPRNSTPVLPHPSPSPTAAPTLSNPCSCRTRSISASPPSLRASAGTTTNSSPIVRLSNLASRSPATSQPPALCCTPPTTGSFRHHQATTSSFPAHPRLTLSIPVNSFAFPSIPPRATTTKVEPARTSPTKSALTGTTSGASFRTLPTTTSFRTPPFRFPLPSAKPSSTALKASSSYLPGTASTASPATHTRVGTSGCPSLADSSSAPTLPPPQPRLPDVSPTRRTNATPSGAACATRFNVASGSPAAQNTIPACPLNSRAIPPPCSPNTARRSSRVSILIAAASFPRYSSTHPPGQLFTTRSDSPLPSRPMARTSATHSMSSISAACSPETPSGRRAASSFVSPQSSSRDFSQVLISL